MAVTEVPYGEWASPITPAMVVERAVALSSPCAIGEDVYWVEGRPAEAGRNVVVRLAPGQAPQDVTPAGLSVRTRVHEYGGGAYLVEGDTLWFSNFADGRLHRQDRRGGPSTPVTPPPADGESLRYGDLRRVPGPVGGLVAVREHHAGGEVRNEIVWLDGQREDAGVVLVTG